MAYNLLFRLPISLSSSTSSSPTSSSIRIHHHGTTIQQNARPIRIHDHRALLIAKLHRDLQHMVSMEPGPSPLRFPAPVRNPLFFSACVDFGGPVQVVGPSPAIAVLRPEGRTVRSLRHAAAQCDPELSGREEGRGVELWRRIRFHARAPPWTGVRDAHAPIAPLRACSGVGIA